MKLTPEQMDEAVEAAKRAYDPDRLFDDPMRLALVAAYPVIRRAVLVEAAARVDALGDQQISPFDAEHYSAAGKLRALACEVT